MAKIKTRLDRLEAQAPDDHHWKIVVFADENDQIKTKHYKDGQEVSLAQWHKDYKPKPGEPIEVEVTDFSK